MSSNQRAQHVVAAAAETSPWRSIGVWMALFLIGYILVNAVRAVVDPATFAITFGVPAAIGERTFILVYASRSLFLGLFGLALVIRRDFAALSVFALVGVVMPLGDAALVAATGGAGLTVIRHLLTGVFLAVTGLLIRRWLRRGAVLTG